MEKISTTMEPNIPTEIITSNLPQWEQLFKVAPITLTILGVAFCGFLAAWWLLSKHISDLKEIIQWLREKK